MTQTQTTFNTDKFQNAEQIWFWFTYSRSVRNNLQNHSQKSCRRVCELVDVETLVTKLYLCGKLNDEHLRVMKKYGDKKRAPHQYVWHENHDAAIWNDAMKILDTAAHAKGWTE